VARQEMQVSDLAALFGLLRADRGRALAQAHPSDARCEAH
jgi:hypothetical protein